MERLPEIARDSIEEYLKRALPLLSGRLVGCYAVGSLCLGDWHAATSDIDLVTVTSERLTPTDLAALRDVHTGLPTTRPAPPSSHGATDPLHVDVTYTTPAELAADPRGSTGPSALEGAFTDAGPEERHPVAWTTLARHGVPLRGPSPSTLGVWQDAGALHEYVLANLHDYWQRWHTRGSDPADPIHDFLLQDWAVFWVVTGISRQHHTLKTGRITTKGRAPTLALPDFPDHAPILTEAASLRHSPTTYASPALRRTHTLTYLSTLLKTHP